MSMFTEKNLKKIEELKKRYPTTKALTLPVLWMAQQQFGWISEETMQEVAHLLGVPVKHIYGVVSFYTMFNAKPVGRYHIQICRNVSCQLLGSERITEHICGRLNITLGETTPDKKFTVSEVECLGSCGTAPMMQVNEEYHENLTAEKIDKLLDSLK
jgi:NADH-quinone oxidoreductase E subunit